MSSNFQQVANSNEENGVSIIPISSPLDPPDHSSPSHEPIPPSLDPLLSSIRLFWYLFWTCLAEVIFVGSLVVNYTVMTFMVEESKGEHHIAWSSSESEGGSKSEDDSPSVPLVFALLYFIPSCIVIGGGCAVFFSKRNDYLLRKVYLGFVVLALLLGIAGTCYSLYSYIVTYHEANCHEYEGWSAGAVRTFYVVLTLCPLAFRMGLIKAVRYDVIYPHGLDKESAFEKDLPEDVWSVSISAINAVIMACCMPLVCRDIKTEHTKHIVQHIMQLIYEIVLLIVAIVETKYIELVAIVAGVLGSIMGLAKLHMLDSIFNIFALATGVFLLANNIARFKCVDLEAESNPWLYLVMFSLIASTIRFKSVMHTFVESRAQIHAWVQAQVGWVTALSDSNNRRFRKFCHVRNFLTLRSYSGPAHKHEPEKTHSHSTTGPTTETSPLLSSSSPAESTAEKKPPKPISKLECISSLTICFSFLLLLAFAITIGILFPVYSGGAKVDELLTWRATNCTLLSNSYIFGQGNLLYYYRVNASGYGSIIGIPVETRYHNPSDLSSFNTKFNDKLANRETLECRVPSYPLYSRDLSVNLLDYGRTSFTWEQVSILNSDSSLHHFQSMYYLWISLPSIMMGIALIACIVSCVICCRSIQKK